MALHDRRVTFRPPAYHKDKGPLSVWAVYVHETDMPQGVEPIEWCLLTTCPIASVEDAETRLRWYCPRWRIEIGQTCCLRRCVLDSGCVVKRQCTSLRKMCDVTVALLAGDGRDCQPAGCTSIRRRPRVQGCGRATRRITEDRREQRASRFNVERSVAVDFTMVSDTILRPAKAPNPPKPMDGLHFN